METLQLKGRDLNVPSKAYYLLNMMMNKEVSNSLNYLSTCLPVSMKENFADMSNIDRKVIA